MLSICPAASLSSWCARSERARAAAISSPICMTSRSSGLQRARPWPTKPTPVVSRASARVSRSSSRSDISTGQLSTVAMITHLFLLVSLCRGSLCCLHSPTDGDLALTLTCFRATALARPGPIVSYHRNRSVAGGDRAHRNAGPHLVADHRRRRRWPAPRVHLAARELQPGCHRRGNDPRGSPQLSRRGPEDLLLPSPAAQQVTGGRMRRQGLTGGPRREISGVRSRSRAATTPQQGAWNRLMASRYSRNCAWTCWPSCRSG